jgi:acyl carrier protein
LAVKDSGIDKILMSPEEKKDRVTEALGRITLKGSEIRPLIMAFEDKFGGEISDEDAQSIVTVGDVVRFIDKN